MKFFSEVLVKSAVFFQGKFHNTFLPLCPILSIMAAENVSEQSAGHGLLLAFTADVRNNDTHTFILHTVVQRVAKCLQPLRGGSGKGFILLTG